MIDLGFAVSRIPLTRIFFRGLLAVVLLLTFRTFQFFPGMFYVQEAWFILCFLCVFLFYPAWKIQSGLQFSWFEIYLFVLLIADVVLAAWQSHQVFGQPLLYGILAQRSMALVAASLLIFNAFQFGFISWEDIEAALLYLTWGTFFLYSAMRLLLNPENFTSYGLGFVTEPMPGVRPDFKFQVYFILFGMFYYAILGIQKRQTWCYLAAAVLFLSAVGPTGRGLTVFAVVTLLYFLYKLRGARQALVTAMKFGCVFAIAGAAAFVISPANFLARAGGFGSAFSVILTGSATSADPSANARIFESLAVLPYIQSHPMLGNGVVSNQWQGGIQGALGQYFYPSDIGMVGILYCYGAIGFLLYALQYVFAYRAAKRPSMIGPVFLDAIKAFILFTALYSVETGIFVWSAEMTLFFVFLLYAASTNSQLLQSRVTDPDEACHLPRPALSS